MVGLILGIIAFLAVFLMVLIAYRNPGPDQVQPRPPEMRGGYS